MARATADEPPLLDGVAEDEAAEALAAGVYDRILGRGRELLEHLAAQPRDVGGRGAPRAATRQSHRAEQTARLPVPDRVLARTHLASGVAYPLTGSAARRKRRHETVGMCLGARRELSRQRVDVPRHDHALGPGAHGCQLVSMQREVLRERCTVGRRPELLEHLPPRVPREPSPCDWFRSRQRGRGS